MNGKILVIINPVAGNGNFNKNISNIEENFKKSGFDVKTEFTTLENNAEKIVKNANDDIDIIIAIGGDGTLNEIVNGVTKRNLNVKIGFIPIGTTNDFAKTLKVSLDKFELSKKLANAEERKCDTGLFNEKCFNYVSAFGTFTKTSYATPREKKNKFGRLAYVVEGTKDFLGNEDECYHLKIETEDQIIEDDFCYGSISNSNYIGGFKMFKDEEVEINDGKFEVLLIKKQKNKADLLKTYTKIINQKRDNNVIFFKTSNLKITSNKNMKWSLDGELEESNKNVEIKNMCGNINFLVV